MTTMLVWLLIATSDEYYNQGTVTTVERFAKVAQCEHVLKNLALPYKVSAKCIQAEILVPK